MKFYLLCLSLISLFFLPTASFAQSDNGDSYGRRRARHSRNTSAEESNYALPEENFTGTLAEDEDEDNPEYQRNKIERGAFGGDEEYAEGEEGEMEYDEAPPYLMILNFESHVVFSDMAGAPYMEIVYVTRMEKEVALLNKRWRAEADAEFESDIVGNLAGNDLFTCKLDIAIDTFPIDIMTRLKFRPETEEEPASYEVALQLSLQKNYKEVWHSNCTGMDGSTFNTMGDPEKYNRNILDETEPNLHGIVIEDFDPDAGASLEIISEPIDIEDTDMNEIVTLSGTGTLEIEPL